MSTAKERAHEKLGMFLAYQSLGRLALRLATEATEAQAQDTALHLAQEAHTLAGAALESATKVIRDE